MKYTKNKIDSISFSNHKQIKEWEVLDIRDENNNKLYFETPFMYLPFGLEKEYSDYILKLQFRGVKDDSNSEMKEFYNLIKNFEEKIINLKGIEEKKFKSQIIEKNNYDDLLIIKIKKKFFNIDISNSNSEIKNIFDIQKKSQIKCTMHIDNLWSNNKNSICKFILDKIIIYDS